jgi:LysR family transcriptional activator of nhaA
LIDLAVSRVLNGRGQSPMEWLNYHHLNYFWRIAREGSLSRAATTLGVTHSTLSTQLRALEQFLGGQLFERRGRRLVLTTLGEEAASYADEIFRLGGELVEAARGRSQQRRLALRVGVVGDLPKTVAYAFLRPAMRLAKFGPTIVKQNTLERLLEELAGGRLHFALSDTPPPEASAHRVFAHLLGESQILLYGTPDLAKKYRSGFPRSLQRAPMLLPAAPSSLRRQIDRWLVERDLTINLMGEFDDAGLMRAAGLHGEGLFPLRVAIRDEVERLEAAKLVGGFEGILERYYVVSTERRVRHPAVNAIIEQGRLELARAGRERVRASGRRSEAVRSKRHRSEKPQLETR